MIYTKVIVDETNTDTLSRWTFFVDTNNVVALPVGFFDSVNKLRVAIDRPVLHCSLEPGKVCKLLPSIISIVIRDFVCCLTSTKQTQPDTLFLLPEFLLGTSDKTCCLGAVTAGLAHRRQV